MLDYLYAVGQILCLLGLAWGARLALGSSELIAALREAGIARRGLRRRRQRGADVEDPHVSGLGYWP
jgi:hypothetical protein